MPVTRSEALFFTGGLVAGIAAVAAYPWVKKQYDAMREGAQEGESMPVADIGRKVAASFEDFLKAAPTFAEAGKSGMQAGFEAAKRMAESVKAGSDVSRENAPIADPTQAA